MKKLIIILFCIILLVGTISAFNFDNVKKQNDNSIKIKNAFGLGKDLADYTLTSNTYYCDVDCSAEGNVEIYSPEKLFSKLITKDLKGKKKDIEELKIYVRIKEEVIIKFPAVPENKTEAYEEKGYKNVWKKYSGEILEKGFYLWRIEGKKKSEESVDWIATAFGKDLNEWALWRSYQDSACTEWDLGSYNNTYCDGENLTLLSSSTGISLYEYQSSGGEDTLIVSSTTWAGQTFSIGNVGENVDFKPKNITIQAYDAGIINDIVVAIKNVNSSNAPTGADICNGTRSDADSVLGGIPGILYNLSLVDCPYLNSSTNYSIIIYAPSGGVNALRIRGNASNNYLGGQAMQSSDGIVWNLNSYVSYDILFQVWGEAETGGYSNNGSYISRSFSAGNLARWENLTWYSIENSSTNVTFQTRTSNDNSTWSSWSSNHTNPSGLINSSINYLQYKVEFLTTDGNQTSFLQWANVSYTSVPIINIQSPKNQSYTTSTIYFNASAGEPINQWIANWNGTNITLPSINSSLEVEDGSFNLKLYGQDSLGKWGLNDSISFVMDTTAPIVNISFPPNSTIFISNISTYNVSINSSITDNLGLASCSLFNGTANISLDCGSNITLKLGEGWHTIIRYATDGAGNEASNSTTFFINYYRYQVNFTDGILEGETDEIIFNFTATQINEVSAILQYNNTNYTMVGSSNGTYARFSYNVTLPFISASTLIPLKIYYSFNDVNYSTLSYNQSVYYITPLEVAETCSAGLNSAMCFYFNDEKNLSNQNVTLNYNFGFGISNTTSKYSYGTLASINKFCLCINSTLYNNYTLGTGEIQYSSTGFIDRRFYTFSSQRLTNQTINNSLYMLLNTEATSFLFEFQDTSLFPYVNKYTSLMRWYPDLNEYKIVEMAKTDDKGQTIMRVEVEDVDYRVGLYEQNGSIIKLLNPVRFACLSSPCTYASLVQDSTSDYTRIFGVQSDINYNSTNNIWTFTWNDPSQNTKSMRFLVTRERGDGSVTICDTSSSGFTGVITCDSSGYTGTLQALAFRTASPEIPINRKLLNTDTKVLSSSIGLFISLILFLTLALIGIWSPVASIILGLVGLIPAVIFGSITLPIFMAIGVLGGIIIHFMKRSG